MVAKIAASLAREVSLSVVDIVEIRQFEREVLDLIEKPKFR